MDFIGKVLMWLDAPRVIGFLCAIFAGGYLLWLTRRHHVEFWQAVKGDDDKPQFIEMVLVVWLVLFTFLVIGDFAFGLVASTHVWYSMDSIFLIGVGGRVSMVMKRGREENKKAD